MVKRRGEIAWTDPVDALGTLGRASGLDDLLGVMRGDVPQLPILSACDIDPVVAEPGRIALHGGERIRRPRIPFT